MRVVLLHSADALEPPVDPVIEQVASALETLGHDVTRTSVEDDILPVMEALRRGRPEMVFNLTESFAGVSSGDSSLAAMMNLMGLRYTGSSPAGLLLAGDKTLAKKVLRVHDIRTPEFTTLYRGSLDWGEDIGFPLIVKPPQEDASIGITNESVVHDLKELFARIDSVQTEFGQPVLVEQFIEGREFYVGVLGNMHAHALPPIEMDFSGLPAGIPRIASWDAKWGADGSGAGEGAAKSPEFAGTKSVFPSDLGEELCTKLKETAIQAFEALRLRDYARIDMRVDASDRIHVIEVNPNCYLERDAEFARAAERDGMSYHKLIARILELAQARYAR